MPKGKKEGYIPRSKVLQIRLHQHEEDALKERATAAGYKTIPAYLRAVGLGEWPLVAEWVSGPMTIYVAPEGTDAPAITDAPAAPWELVGVAEDGGRLLHPDDTPE